MLNQTILSRKYRPQSFNEVIGQPILVESINNAITNNRIPQAILLTGIRGIGKTTIARLIAKSLNCISNANPTSNPCNVCEQCKSTTASRNQDVLEMDAASHTGVNDIREIIDNCKYKPAFARYKVYIIDEIHMLSNNAFNALLKTLEEPPAHVKFIFATTEVRKIPLTIISRCQRFNLKRLGIENLIEHYSHILEKEGYAADDLALHIIAEASDGSVRDGLSILDQALSLSVNKHISTNIVVSMLGMNNKSSVYSLFREVIGGNINNAIKIIEQIYNDGGDSVLLLQDLLQLVHDISNFQLLEQDEIKEGVKNLVYSNLLTGEQRKEIKFWASKLPTPFLIRSWQIIIKAIEETKITAQQWLVVKMNLIKLAYVNIYETPEQIFNCISNNDTEKYIQEQQQEGTTTRLENKNSINTININTSEIDNHSLEEIYTKAKKLAELALEKKEVMLYHWLMHDISILKLEEGLLKIKILNPSQQNLHSNLKDKLRIITNKEWNIEVLSDEKSNNPTLSEIEENLDNKVKQELLQTDIVKDIMSTFPGIEIKEIEVIK